MSERWVCIGWDHKRHNSAQLLHTGTESACKKLEHDLLLEDPRRLEAVAMTELEWRRSKPPIIARGLGYEALQ